MYGGCKIDYSGNDVTPDTFVKVLTGDTTGLRNTTNGEAKVLKSTSKSKVFVNFVDHGGAGPRAGSHTRRALLARPLRHARRPFARGQGRTYRSGIGRG